MKLLEKINKLKEAVNLLEKINIIAPDIVIMPHAGRDYYCSEIIHSIATDIEMLEPPSYLAGEYRVCTYKDYYINSDNQDLTVRLYGLPFMIPLFRIHLNNLSFYSYEEDLDKNKSNNLIRAKVRSYILNFIKNNKLKLDTETIPETIKSLLIFT